MELGPGNWIELALDLNVALDEGRVVHLDDVCQAIAAGRALEYLRQAAGSRGEYFDESAHSPGVIEKISEAMAEIYHGSAEYHAVEHNGLSLLLALCLEALKSERVATAST